MQKNLSYSRTSFPSKMFTYISAGIFPVFSYSKPIKKWASSNNIGYVCKKNNMYELASYLKKIDYIDHKKIGTIIQQIHESYKKSLSDNLL